MSDHHEITWDLGLYQENSTSCNTHNGLFDKNRAPFHKGLRLIVRLILIVAQWQIVY